MKSYIRLATEALYSEQLDLGNAVQRISGSDRGFELTRAYLAANVAAELTEPLSNKDVDRAIQELHVLIQKAQTSELATEIRRLKQSTETSWSQRRATILEGKRAFERDEWSYEGIIYRMEKAKKGPCSTAERQEFRASYDKLKTLNHQLAELERDEKTGRNIEEVDHDWARLAEQGDAHAQWRLGMSYAFGRGVTKDVTEAVKWCRKAADQGFANAEHYLATCYANGTGVDQDHQEAMRWYHKAAEHGDAGAQCTLGRCYVLGVHVPADAVEGYQWIKRAFDQNYEEATDDLAMVKAYLSADQLREAERRYNNSNRR